jgi:uncharacterized protein YcbX
MAMWLSSISTYPLKGAYRVDRATATVEPCGLAGDRRWLAVDADGRALTQREEPALTRIRPAPGDGGGLLLRTPGMPDLHLTAPDGGDLLRVWIFSDTLDAARAGTDADDWLSMALERKVRLVHLHDPRLRPVDPDYGAAGDRVSFADGYPLLLANAASLDALNDWLAASGGQEPLPMTRFRPNVVVSGAPAWAEDGWLGRRVRLGEVVFRAVKLCARCVVTTTDQETGERGHEPLRTLARHRNVDQDLLFGLNLIPDGTGEIAVGDEVEIVG